MKQLDTIKNHEWIPTELDLENMPRVTSALPTASAQNLGIVYLLDAEQLGYVRSHFYKCILEDGIYKWFDLQVGRFAIGNCRNIQLSLLDDGVALKLLIAWEDPDDVVVGDETTRWAKTVLVHQVGHMPLTVEDGVVLITNTTRNAYSMIGSLSFTIQDNTTSKHYFKLFPYSDDGAITNDDQNGRVAGWNYAVTGDLHPYVLNDLAEAEYKEYYTRTLNTETGLYEYSKLAYNSTNFTDNAGKWEFKSGMTYYVYENCLMNWAGIRELVRNGTAESYFRCGTIFMLPYHGDYGTMAFEVVDHDNVEALNGGTTAHTMTLQAKYLYEWWDQNNIGYVFDAAEAAAATTKDTSRNTGKVYHVSVGNGQHAITLAPTGVSIEQANASGNVYNINWPATVADKLGKKLYPSTHWDTTGRPIEKTEIFYNSNANPASWQMRVPIVNFANSSNVTFVECELSYIPRAVAGHAIAAYATGDANTKLSIRNNRARRNFTRSVLNNTTYLTTNVTTEADNPKDPTITNASYNQDLVVWPWFYPSIPSLVSTDTQFYFSTDTGNRKYGKPYGTVAVYRTAEHYMHPIEKFAQDGTTYYTKSGDTFEEDTGVSVGDDVSAKYVLTTRQVTHINNDGVLSAAAMPSGKPSNLGNDQKITVTSSSNTSPESGYVYFYSISITEPDTTTAKTRFVPILELDVTDGLLKWCVNHWGTQASYTLYKLDAASCILETYIHSYAANISSSGTQMGAATITSGTSALSSSDNGYEIRDATVVGSTWGAYTTNLRTKPWLFIFGPRNNGYADTYIRVPYVNGWRSFDSKIKYFAPVGLTRSLTMSNFGTKKTTHTYALNRGTEFRDITKDISDTIFQLLTDTKDENGKVTVNGQKVAPENYLTFTGPTTVGSINLTQICKDLVLIPSMDSRFIPGKQYFRAQYTELVANGTDTWPSHGIFVRKQTRLIGVPGHQREVTTYVRCNKGTGTISYPYNGSYDTIYKVSFIPMTEHVIADGETAYTTRSSYNASDDACASDGLHYVTGDMIPTRSLTPLYCIRREHVVDGVTYHEGDYRPVAIGSQRRSASGYFKKVDDEYVALGASEDPNGGETATGGQWQGQAYVCYAAGCPEPDCYIWSCDGGVTECDVDCAGQSTSDYNGDEALTVLAGYPGYPSAFVDTDIYQGCISNYTPTPGGTTYEEVQLYWQMPNTERSAYGNHVWSQSNARAYLNGPFDNATEYVPTNDASFITNRRYFEFVAGSGYVEIGSARFTVLKTAGTPIYTKIDNGLPVGVKLDINNPSRYWNYGISARMQYKFVNNDWVPAFETTDLWWGEAMKSVNNGLEYDTLAGMYCYSYIDKGATGNAAYTVSNLYAKQTGSNANNASYVGTGSALKIKDSSGNVIKSDLTTVHVLPRQSFLHGFIDCRYKRTSDTSIKEGKSYYMRNPYGEYIESTNMPSGTNPYNNCLYEENPNYKADIQEAYEFLSAICPVVNRNGLYGTTGAYDLYPHGDPSVRPNLGGTTTVDKVWLASTNQVAGGTSVNNGVYEEWSGSGNGKYATLSSVFELYGLSSSQTTGFKYALEKYAICKTYASIVFGYSGSGDTGLNNSRIRVAYINGLHTASGYTDKLGAAQYWWLRSAGGDYSLANSSEHSLQAVRSVGRDAKYGLISDLAWLSHKSRAQPLNTWARLSPLITIG